MHSISDTDAIPSYSLREYLTLATKDSDCKDEWIWLDRPHERFKYPEFPLLPKEEEENLENYAQRLIHPKAPHSVQILPDLKAAILDWMRHHKIHTPGHREAAQLKRGTLLALEPYFEELPQIASAAHLNLHPIPRDPESWHELYIPTDTVAVVLSNPNQADGFFYPQELYVSLIKKLREKTQAPILSEEGLQIFSFNSVTPGTLKDFRSQKNKISTAASIYPAMSPQGPKLAWWIADDAEHVDQGLHLRTNEEELALGCRALLAFQSKQGSAVAEFHRRMLAVNTGLRALTDLLSPALLNKQLKIPHWPETGFQLILDLGPTMKTRGFHTSLQTVVDIANSCRIGLKPGSYLTKDNLAVLCYAASPKILEEAGQRLKKYFAANSAATTASL